MASTRITIVTGMVLLFLSLATAPQAVSAPQPQIKEFTIGDVMVAVRGGKVEWHNPDGSLFKILDTTVGGNTAGLAFKPGTKNLFVTNIGSNTVTIFDPIGNSLGRFGAGYEVGPASIVFDSSGSAFVGQASGVRLVKLDGSGHIVNNFKIAFDNRGFTWIDLAPDQCTMYYTTNGTSIMRFDVCKNVQMPDFTSNLPGTAYALRLLPGGGLLVADSQEILRFDTNGKPVQIYAQGKFNWFGMNLDPDGKSFWSTDLDSNGVFKFDLASGKQLLAFKVSSDANAGGLAVFGEITVAQPTPAPSLTPTPTRTPTLTPTQTRTPTPFPTPTQTPTLSPTPTAPPLPLPPPTRPVPIPTPPTRSADGSLQSLIVGGLGLGGLATLAAIAVIAIAVIRRQTRPSIDQIDSKTSQKDRDERAKSNVKVQGRDDPGQQTVEPKPHQPTPSTRISLGQGEANYVIETEDQKKTKGE